MLLLIIGLGQWVRDTAEGLQRFIVEVPIYVAGPAMVVIGALDSSLLSLPEINDYLVVMRCYSDPKAAFYFPLFAALGSVIGCMLLYTILQRGGQAVLRKRFRAEHIERVERAYARYGFLTLAIPALLPPPMPFKIFVATAGALEYPRWRFMTTIMIARSLRYYIEGALAVYYGRQVLEFIEHYGLMLLGTVAALCLGGLAVYLIAKRFRTAGQSGAIESEIKTDANDKQDESEGASSSRIS
jgi:membrane protein YqaA with SNARE-associated domain